jgi:hypothetical protein
MDYKSYIYLAGAGLLVTSYKVFKNISEGIRLKVAQIITEILLALIISLLIVPKIMLFMGWGIEGGMAINAVLNIFSKFILMALEKAIPKKIEDKIGNL